MPGFFSQSFGVVWALASLSAAAALGSSPPASAAGVIFSPHRAVYEIKLGRTSAGSGVSDMTGRMVYELTGSPCEGYTQNMRFVTRTTNSEGADTINDLRTSSWEEVAGKRLRFSTTQYQNEDIAEASQGDATRSKSAPGTSVDLVKPGKKHVALPDDTYFPMQHATALIESARAGRQIFPAKLYDGSEKGDKVYTTTAVIGTKIGDGAVRETAAFKDRARLAGLNSWPVAISYFEPGKDKQDSTPAYELSFRYYENGVTSDLNLDYGEFALKGELKELTMLDASKCQANAGGPQ